MRVSAVPLTIKGKPTNSYQLGADILTARNNIENLEFLILEALKLAGIVPSSSTGTFSQAEWRKVLKNPDLSELNPLLSYNDGVFQTRLRLLLEAKDIVKRPLDDDPAGSHRLDRIDSSGRDVERAIREQLNITILRTF